MTATLAAEIAPATTREEWLVRAVEAFRPMFEEIGEAIPAVRVSVGWPGGNGRKNSVIGQCWHKSAAADEVAQIFVSPVLDDAARVLDVLAHEVIHAIDENASGHRGNFARIAKAFGLTGAMTATVAGEDLKARLDLVIEEIGAYPHARLGGGLLGGGEGEPKPGDPGTWLFPKGGPADGPKKQGTRMLKVVCAEGSDFKVRTTRKMLDEFGAPLCPCHSAAMVEA